VTVSSVSAGLAEEIRRYCAEHPDARDTLEGIAWWLAMQRQNETLNDLRAAVDSLVAEGLLVEHRLSDGSVVFGCADGNCAKGPA
jgi:hypothetical protein